MLIFSLWSPERSKGEKLAILRSFEAHEQWLRQRKIDRWLVKTQAIFITCTAMTPMP